MNTLTLFNPIKYTSSLFSPSIFLFHFPSLSLQNGKFLHIPHTNSANTHNPQQFSTIKATPTSTSNSNSNSVIYGGWDDLRVGGDWINSGESTELRDFLVSIGIDDKKHVFTFLLGVFCALAISRVRISSIIVFPASVLIFAIGFSFGFVRGGSFSEFSVTTSKRRAREEIFRAHGDRLKSLLGFFDGLDVKVGGLRSDIQRAIDAREIALDNLENYVGVIESIKLLSSNTKNVIEAIIDGMGNPNGATVENQKLSSRKRKEIGEVGFELFQFVGSLFGENMVNSKPNKVKGKESHEVLAKDKTQGKSTIENGGIDVVDYHEGNRKSILSQGLRDKSALDWDGEKRVRVVSENAKINSEEMGGSGKTFSVDGEEYSYQNNRLQFVNNHHVSWKMDQDTETETWTSHDNLLESVDFSVSYKHVEKESSFVREQMFKRSSGAYGSLYGKKINIDETSGSQFREERVNHHSNLADDQSVPESDVGSTSSVISDDIAFDRCLSEANNLLKEAKECIRNKYDEEHAEIILYKSAKLLSKAISMKPMSLLAIGQLGNTYLLHGELKLKVSRELRTLLSRRGPLSIENQSRILRGLQGQVINQKKIASVLIDVCEECEELLVEAGRKYRIALSIDGNDVRALYNWGLALSFRAQLIADIGPEAAFDADKVFLAAIDKFDAMMSKGNVYAPDALFRWGVVLQQRSRLRPSNSKEKMKLLQQAKRLYEDALHMDSNNPHVRKALSSCVYELRHRLL